MVRGISSHLWTKTPYLVFFGILYLHLWLWVDPSLLYYGSQAADQFPFCPLTWSYLVSHLPFAGGLTEYCAAFLSQLYHDAWAGALTLTGVAALLGWVVSASVRAVAGTRVPLVWAVPSLFVVVLANRYTHALLGLLNILAGLAAVRVYARAARGGWPVRVVLFLVISMLAYSIAPLGYAVYAVLCGCSELRKRRGWWLAAGYLVAAASVPYVLGVGVVGWDVGSPRARLLPPEMSIYSVGKASVGWLVWFLFGVGACAGLYGWRSRAAGSAPPGDAKREDLAAGGPVQGAISWVLQRISRPAYELELMLVVGVVAAMVTFDANRVKIWQVSAHAARSEWEDVVEVAQTLPRESYAPPVLHMVTRALYETGQLPSEMFSLPRPRSGYMLAWGLPSRKTGTHLRRETPLGVQTIPLTAFSPDQGYQMRLQLFFAFGDLHLRLGLVNEAEHEACEALEIFGEHPAILERLALIHLVKGQSESAEVFLQALRHHLHYRTSADRAICDLHGERSLLSDAAVQGIRANGIGETPAALSPVLEDRFDALRRANPRNRMAFEYWMAFLLLNLQLDDFVQGLDGLDALGYQGIPRHYEEAILVHERVRNKDVDLRGREIREETRGVYDAFLRALEAYYRRGGRPSVRRAIEEQFGHTYFFYYHLGEM